MLKDTLIVWAGEFGRTPMSQGGDGRDHHNKGFTVWVAGGGVKGGLSYGATDELGYAAVEKVASVHDLHATMLHLLGIDPNRLSRQVPGPRRPSDRRRALPGAERHPRLTRTRGAGRNHGSSKRAVTSPRSHIARGTCTCR